MVHLAQKFIIMMKRQTMKEKKINTAVKQNDMSYKQGRREDPQNWGVLKDKT